MDKFTIGYSFTLHANLIDKHLSYCVKLQSVDLFDKNLTDKGLGDTFLEFNWN